MITFFYSDSFGRYPRVFYTTNSKRNKGDRSEDNEQLEAFEKTCTCFGLHEDEQLTLSELLEIMEKKFESPDKSAYTKVHFKRNSNEDGKPDSATLKSSVKTILRK